MTGILVAARTSSGASINVLIVIVVVCLVGIALAFMLGRNMSSGARILANNVMTEAHMPSRARILVNNVMTDAPEAPVQLQQPDFLVEETN